ncbi:COG1802 Transcriptional regulators [Vibrio sp. B1FLJ16]|uniref:GntR family transcriptional regulator n=1 Tax=Vibrio sp. B1FLJ16 TaxID=2751178 RepID=UPI0015F751B0|nr:GntR family transcriptional regulator [Vibrio sp. B1FLJ16]MCA0934464.1 GntR family transcriptional regulator [Vibrio alginolyticus]CAD7817613.1 COG1802 Transcriptional regulators [Vibrio sp. B1FLJ16]CAE6931767.1 COG1802 Transcriptional regulators [Vibrio sp. B1FLJ16]
MVTSRSKASTHKQQEVQRIMGSLSKAIAQHKLKPGQRLVEAQIVAALDANRNHVQTALQRLALQHIVTIEPNRGALVSQPSEEEAREVFAARRVIERGIVESISPQTIEERWSEIEAHMLAEQEAIKTNDRRAIVSALTKFHRMLADMCGNRILIEMFDNLMVRSSLIVALYQRNDVPSCQHDEHQSLIDALKSGNTEQATSVMIAHLDHLEAELVLSSGKDQELELNEALRG